MAQNTQYRRYAPRRGKKTKKGGLPLIVWLVAIAILIGALVLFVVNCQGRTTKNVLKVAYPQKYSEYVNKAAADYNLPPALIYAVIRTESGFDSGAVSPAGAVGLMQLMPATFEWLTDDKLFEHLESGMLYDPETNIKYGTYCLSYLYDRYGDWETALAAYNGGLGNVDEWLESDRYADGEGGLKRIPFKETRQFVARVTDAWEMYERLYGNS